MLISPILAFKNPPKSPVTEWPAAPAAWSGSLWRIPRYPSPGPQSFKNQSKAIQYWNVLGNGGLTSYHYILYPFKSEKRNKTNKVGTPFADFANMMALRGFQPTKTWDVHKECKDLTKHRYTNQSKINESGPSFWTLVGRRRVQHGKDSPIVHLLARNDHHVVHLMGWSYL